MAVMIEKKKPWYKQVSVWLIFCAILFISIFIAYLINKAYLLRTSDSNPNTAFTAGDTLGFYGSFLAFSGTIFLGILSLKQNQRANHVNRDMARRQLEMSNVEQKRAEVFATKQSIKNAILAIDIVVFDNIRNAVVYPNLLELIEKIELAKKNAVQSNIHLEFVNDFCNDKELCSACTKACPFKSKPETYREKLFAFRGAYKDYTNQYHKCLGDALLILYKKKAHNEAVAQQERATNMISSYIEQMRETQRESEERFMSNTPRDAHIKLGTFLEQKREIIALLQENINVARQHKLALEAQKYDDNQMFADLQLIDISALQHETYNVLKMHALAFLKYCDDEVQMLSNGLISDLSI